QLGLGGNLLHALATGHSWFYDKSRLQTLSRFTTVRKLKRDLENFLKAAGQEPPTIDVVISSYGFHGRVAQYEYSTLKALEEKLTQFPAGTKFWIGDSSGQSERHDRLLSELKSFLTDKGMSVIADKQ